MIPLGIYFLRIIQNYRKFDKAIFSIYSLQHFTTKHCNFTKFSLSSCGNIFPISIFFKISSKRLKVQWINGKNTQGYQLGIIFHNTNVYKICQIRKAIFSIFQNISQPNFTILLSLGCSFHICL